jgi:VanZ family protein
MEFALAPVGAKQFHLSMHRRGTFLKFWLPVILWMACIFSASGDSMSGEHTSHFLGPLIKWFFPKISDALVAEIVFDIRKCAHVTEYAVLGLLFWRAWRQPVRGDTRPWDWALARRAFLATALYAATDEFHQLFVPSREARVHDVAIDASGAAAAMLVLWGFGRWRKHW